MVHLVTRKSRIIMFGEMFGVKCITLKGRQTSSFKAMPDIAVILIDN